MSGKKNDRENSQRAKQEQDQVSQLVASRHPLLGDQDQPHSGKPHGHDTSSA
jgi:hypothetical protein